MKVFEQGKCCWVVITLGLLLALSSIGANAGVIRFDDLDASRNFYADPGYDGFEWGAQWKVGTTSTPGFGGSVTNGTPFLYNSYSNANTLISRSRPFDFLGVDISSSTASRAFWARLLAYDSKNNEIGRINITLGTTPQTITASFSNVSWIMIDPLGGKFAIDNFQYRSQVASLSEAGALALFAIGLLGLWAARRRTS